MRKPKYTAVYEQDGEAGRWMVSIAEVPGAFTQGRGLAQARDRIIEALSALLDRDVSPEEVRDDVRLPPKARRVIASYRKARRDAERAQEKASARSRDAVRELVVELGMSTRDAGAALGVSQARAAQLARER